MKGLKGESVKALFVGLGSIGTRHLKNLSNLCQNFGIGLEVVALRSGKKKLPDDVCSMVHRQVQTLLDEDFEIAFITGPTHLHAISIAELKGRVGTFFIEKPILDHSQYSLDALGLGQGQKAYVAAPMRWTSTYIALKKHMQNLKVYCARAICSSYLPSWRQGVDYRQVYSAKKEMGGGVSLDLIHEWDYLQDLFGPPLCVHNMAGKYSHLEINSVDISVYIARWEKMLGELHLDYFGKEYCRKLELYCETGTAVADFGRMALSLPNGETQNLAEDLNCRYEREMEYFLNYALNGQGESINSPKTALQILKTALGENE